MILLTKNNAKERCRTCLCKLLKDEDDTYDIENVMLPFQSKFADISLNKELQELLEKCVPIQLDEEFCKGQLYPQCVCMECLKHLETFNIFRNKALDSAMKLYKVFSGSSNTSKVELNDDGQECKTDKRNSRGCVKDDIFNLFLKDSLMETEAVILDGGFNNNDLDPDPFQYTQKHDKIKKPRARRAKSKTDCIINRKSKKLYRLKGNESTKCEFKITVQNKNINKDGTETSNCFDSSFEDPDNSTDNEVLSKKIIHSDMELTERKEKQKERSNADLEENNAISSNEYRTEDVYFTEENRRDLKNKIIKTELCSDDEVSFCGEINSNEDILPSITKAEKKKRHYILNSGRKKGLANRFKCERCQHKFGHKLTLEAHIRKVHEGQKKAFKCQHCDKAYSFIGGLSTHIRDVHERKQDSYDCNIPGCDKKYSNFITLQRHVRFKHLNMETPHQYVCEQCGATFKQSSNLRYHMKTRHPTEEDLKRKELLPKDRLECEECKKSFHSQYTLKYHKLRVHADEKKFECKICGRRVAKQFMLDSHMLVHSDQKMACKFCGREFVRKYQVEAHIRAVHQKLKPFQCPHCSESFASRKTLRHHIYIHTGEKPYICDICGQAYRQPTCLKNHRKIHNKFSSTIVNTALAANHSFISNFEQNKDDVANGAKNIVSK